MELRRESRRTREREREKESESERKREVEKGEAKRKRERYELRVILYVRAVRVGFEFGAGRMTMQAKF